MGARFSAVLAPNDGIPRSVGPEGAPQQLGEEAFQSRTRLARVVRRRRGGHIRRTPVAAFQVPASLRPDGPPKMRAMAARGRPVFAGLIARWQGNGPSRRTFEVPRLIRL